MRKSRLGGVLLAGLALTALTLVGCKGPAPVETNLVEIRNNSYSPVVSKTRIASAVTFKNTDNVVHTITNDNAPTPNQTLDPGGEMIFNPGENIEINYHCEIHKFKGKLVVAD